MPNEDDSPIFEVWGKYESIAMHFNDLLIKLRTQAIGGVAAIATIVAVISKSATDASFNWAIMASVFFFLIIFWAAVWVLDFKYYNRLLMGTVEALIEIEELSKTETHVKELSMSHKIEDAVAGRLPNKHPFGRNAFYLIVFSGLLVGLLFSIYKYLCP